MDSHLEVRSHVGRTLWGPATGATMNLRMTRVLTVFSFVSVVSLVIGARTVVPVVAAAACEGLAALKLPDTTITSAESVAAGAFVQPGARGGRGGDAASTLP